MISNKDFQSVNNVILNFSPIARCKSCCIQIAVSVASSTACVSATSGERMIRLDFELRY